MLSSDEQPPNAPSPILFTLCGTTALLSEAQPKNASSLISARLSGKVTSPFIPSGTVKISVRSLLYKIPSKAENSGFEALTVNFSSD